MNIFPNSIANDRQLRHPPKGWPSNVERPINSAFLLDTQRNASANVGLRSIWKLGVHGVGGSAEQNPPPPLKYDRRRVLGELCETFEECEAANWDGEGAPAVTKETYLCAYRFLEALPSHIESPTVSADTDGHMTLEWYRSPRRTISVSISPDGELHYAALIDSRKYHATEPFESGNVPEILLSLVRRVTAA